MFPSPKHGNDLLFHLDLSILAYHVYHQTLVCPLDPFYEQIIKLETISDKVHRRLRDEFMTETMAAIKRGDGNFGNHSYHGPGNLQGWPSLNQALDPIITSYSQIKLWSASFQNDGSKWEFIKPAKYITDKIKTVYMCRYKPGGNSPVSKETQIDIVRNRPNTIISNSDDEMYCFEGGTGGLEEGNTVHAWSMLGFVLVENYGTNYEVHITFRGSRSGWGARSLAQGITTGVGNPDWVSNMDFQQSTNLEFCSPQTGEVHRGFAKSIHNTSPTILACLHEIHKKKQTPPKRISVTGHSLGGGLAIMFTSNMMIGSYGPNGTRLTDGLENWPWPQLELITFSAPPVGNKVFVNQINSCDICRVYIPSDPIVNGLNPYACHVGRPIELEGPTGLAAHEFDEMRKGLVLYLKKKYGPSSISTSPDDHSIIDKQLSFHALWVQHGPVLDFSYLNEFRQYLLLYLSCLIATFKQKQKDEALINDISHVYESVKKGYNTIFDQNTKFSKDPKLNNLLIVCLLLLRLAESGLGELNMNNIQAIKEI